MATEGNYYLDLRVPWDATQDEIRRAYKAAALRLHPDVNPAPGSSELFISVQQAYEILSNPEKRASYDSVLGIDPKTQSTISNKVIFSRSSIPQLSDPQLFYVMLELAPSQVLEHQTSAPVNIAFVLDRSTSMQGVKMDLVKENAVRMLKQMKSEDIISIIAFSDQAEVLVPGKRTPDLDRAILKINMLQPGGSTEILRGLQCGLAEIRRNLNPKYINQLILLTDGHTYGDEEACYLLAKEAADQGIGLSSLGLGNKFNDEFLDKLASFGGGSSAFVSAPKDLRKFMEEKFSNLARGYAENVTFEFTLNGAIDLQYAFRISPEAGPLPLVSPLKLGRVLSTKPLTVLLELLIKGLPRNNKEVFILDGRILMDVPSKIVPIERINIELKCPIDMGFTNETPDADILQAMSQLSLYRMQEKARKEVEEGDISKATRHLQYLATNLFSKGENELAHAVMNEAQFIHESNKFSSEGEKRIKYGTRGLLLPAGMESE